MSLEIVTRLWMSMKWSIMIRSRKTKRSRTHKRHRKHWIIVLNRKYRINPICILIDRIRTISLVRQK